MLNRIGPKIEPHRTPFNFSRQELKTDPIFTR